MSLKMRTLFLTCLLACITGCIAGCITPADCNYNGVCYNETCHCQASYVTYGNITENGECGYRRKETSTAFFLQPFFGAGLHYLGYGSRADGYTAYFVIASFLSGCLKATESPSGGLVCAYVVLVLPFVIWALVEFIQIANGTTKDTNDVALTGWT